MKKKSFLKIGGAMLLMAIVLNIQYAWGDYGVKDHPLHLEVLAQNNDTGDRGGEATLSVSKASTSCESGGNAQCSSLSCGDFWIRFAQAHGTAAAD